MKAASHRGANSEPSCIVAGTRSFATLKSFPDRSEVTCGQFGGDLQAAPGANRGFRRRVAHTFASVELSFTVSQEMLALQRPAPGLLRLSRFPTLSCQPVRRTPFSRQSFATHASQAAAVPRTERKLRMILLGAPVSNGSGVSGHRTL